MANKDLFKQAIAEAKSVREAAIANAKEALEESLTPHLKDMLAAKLQELDNKDTLDEKAVAIEEVEEAKDDSKDEAMKKDDKDEAIEENDGFTAVEEAEEDEKEEVPAEDDSEESEDEVEDAIGDEDGEAEEIDGDEDLSKLSVDQFKDMIKDIIAQEVGGGAEMGDDMDAGDIEGMGDEAPIEEPGMEGEPEMGAEEEEIDLDELLRELDAISEEDTVDEADAKDKDEDSMEESTEVEVSHESDTKDKNINDTMKEDLAQAMATIETLQSELNEVNILNAKLLYVNKIFKAQNLSESQKVNVIAAFDKAETVKEVKLVFETVVDNVGTKKETTIKEHKGSASKATGITAKKPEVIAEVSDAVLRMQKLAGIIKY